MRNMQHIQQKRNVFGTYPLQSGRMCLEKESTYGGGMPQGNYLTNGMSNRRTQYELKKNDFEVGTSNYQDKMKSYEQQTTDASYSIPEPIQVNSTAVARIVPDKIKTTTAVNQIKPCVDNSSIDSVVQSSHKIYGSMSAPMYSAAIVPLNSIPNKDISLLETQKSLAQRLVDELQTLDAQDRTTLFDNGMNAKRDYLQQKIHEDILSEQNNYN